ncbi:helix-turn-helix transcriptional regulator [Herbiconiux sp. CPCC 205763]|uniref:Helix-turn-helix transcriptional regulator n=1 Tax=Herbiconiux aconitum TaxID=2970913 RepID=A0ABT2GUC6_9MICO|nr:helix-turn-helix transcriptional regulator [Herbiconiux aconitum]MCS5719736.1 helix-turn-helix transcriptional regulator [Herbiconiux aconitum]
MIEVMIAHAYRLRYDNGIAGGHMSTIEAIARARRRKRLSIAEVARRSGLQASNLSAIEGGSREPTARNLDRAARGAGLHLVVADLGGRHPVTEVADAVAASGEDEWGKARLLVQLANDLAVADPFAKLLLAAEAPRSLSPEWDAAMAGIVEWRLEQVALPSPEWVIHTIGDPRWKWSIWPGTVRAEADDVPEPLLRRGVWLAEHELESV